MFRTTTIVLALAALMACAACNNVTGPVASDDQAPVSLTTQHRGELSDPGDGSGGAGQDPRTIYGQTNNRRVRDGRIANRGELSDPGDGSGGAGQDPRTIYGQTNNRRVRDGRIANRVELSDPGDGGGGSGEGQEPGKDFRRPRPGSENQYDDGNGSDPARRAPNGTGGR